MVQQLVKSRGTMSPTLGIGIGMAYIDKDFSKTGTSVKVQIRTQIEAGSEVPVFRLSLYHNIMSNPSSVTSRLNRVEVCFAPCDFHQYEEGFDLIVVIDVLRATSAICTAIEHGVKGIIPVATLEEAKEYQEKGYIVAAERNGAIVEGFDLGNSPYSYMNPELKGKTVALTTTNGTKAIRIAEQKKTVVIGSLNNLESPCDWLIKQKRDVLVLASGWKDKFNLETPFVVALLQTCY